jgi:formylglycine-generating enzyme required for sulfatase activity
MKIKSILIALILVVIAFNEVILAQRKKPSREIIQPKIELQKRVALIIGNGDYKSVSRLNNAVKDSRDMSKALQQLGFEVIGGENLSVEAMKRAILEFGEKLRQKKGVGVFYYAGHGVQLNGRNYLIPVEANGLREQTIEFDAVDVNRVLAEMDAAENGLNLVILDACRNNPFSRSWRGEKQEGLAGINAPSGTLIAYATSPGEVASDGKGENGLYTSALLKWMKEPDLKVEEMFKKVRVEVVRNSQNKQIPWESSSLQGDFYFNPERIKQAITDALKPGNPSKSEDGLKVQVNPVLSEKPKYKGKLLTYSFETPYLKDENSALVMQKKEVNYFVEKLDKNVDLDMIEILGGAFSMGSTTDEARKAWKNGQEEIKAKNYPGLLPFDQFETEIPARTVTIKPFFISKFEITQAQWRAIMGDLNFVENTGIAGMKNDKHPIFGVTWAEAKEFCQKLLQKTGKKYRLPTEAEWEYAARAGSTTAFSFGDTIDRTLVNFGYSNSIFNFPDRSVSKFYPNAFGLYQMHGNVDELCEDVWNPNQQNALLDGSTGTNATSVIEHVIRGGNFQNLAFECRSASRDGVPENKRTFTIGFRIVGEVK